MPVPAMRMQPCAHRSLAVRCHCFAGRDAVALWPEHLKFGFVDAHKERIVCLAGSRRLTGRCIAGRELKTGSSVGKWIRPVSERESMEVSEYERQYEDGSDPKLLDIIDVPLIEPRPIGHQSENWLLDPKWYWENTGSFPRAKLASLTEPVKPLRANGQSTVAGRSDRIPIELQKDDFDSLRLIRVSRLQIAVFAPGEAFGNSKRRVQGRFRHAGDDYALWVTDPAHERSYLKKPNGTYEVSECWLTISLAEEYKGAIYKLIAAIIEP